MNLSQEEIAEQYTLLFRSSWGDLITDGLGIVKKDECIFNSIAYTPIKHTLKIVMVKDEVTDEIDEIGEYFYSDVSHSKSKVEIIVTDKVIYDELEEVNYLRNVTSVNLKRLKYDADRFNLPNLVDTEEILFVELTMYDGTKIEPDYSMLNI